MRRTRHVVLPVRSWQYVGLLLVSLACVTFGLVARDREGQAGSLTGPELLHRAPHDVDVCPNLDPFQKLPACLDSLEKLNSVLKSNDRRVFNSGTVRIERKRSIESSISSTRLLERRLSRSLERLDERNRNVRSINRKSLNTEVEAHSRRLARDFTDRTRRMSRTFNDRSRSMDRREEREIQRRVLENRELRERRERFEVAARKTIGTRNLEKREIRENDRFRDMVRSIKEKRDSDQERTRDRRSNSLERRESRLENREKSNDRKTNSIERRESRLESRERTHDRRSNFIERRESRLENRERTPDRRLNSIEKRESRLENPKRSHDRRSNSIKKRESRLENPERSHDRRSNSIERRESKLENRERIRDRRSNSVERRESKLENRERYLINEQRDSERRNTRLNTLNRERRSSTMKDRIQRTLEIRTNDRERESTRLTDLRDIRRRHLQSEIRDVRSRSQEKLDSGNRREDRRKIEILDRRSRLTDRLDTNRLNNERRIALERRVGTERKVSENLNRREDERFNRRATDLERRRLLDRRARSLDRRTTNGLDREKHLNLERRISIERASENLNRGKDQRFIKRTTDLESHRLLDRRSLSLDRRTTNRLDRERRVNLERRISIERSSENLNRRENRREFANRLSQSRFAINRDFRGEIDRTRFVRSTESSDSSKDRKERRNIFLSRGSLERRSSDSTDRREIATFRLTMRSIAPENKNSLRIVRYSSDPLLAYTRNERADRREQGMMRERINDDYRSGISRVNRNIYLSRQERRLSRSLEMLNRSNSMERRESLENRRTKTDNDRRSTVLSTERRETQLRRSIARAASAMLRTNDLRERRNSNARIQERFVGKIERNTNIQRRFTDSSSISMVERLIESRPRDQRRNLRSNLTVKQTLERRNSDSRIQYTDSRIDLEKGLKMIERSGDNADRRSSERRLVDLRQSDSLRDKIRTSELSTRIRNTLIVPSIDRDRLYLARDRSLEKNRRLLDLDRRVRKITQDSRDDHYGRKLGVISSILTMNALPNYDLTFEVIRQIFVITICIVYGLSMSNNKKLFTGNLMDRINRFALR